MLGKKTRKLLASILLGLTVGGLFGGLFVKANNPEPQQYHTVPIEQQVQVDYTDTVLSELTSINKLEIYQAYLKNTVTIKKGFDNKFFRNNKSIDMYATGIYKLDLNNIDKDLVMSGNSVVVIASIEHDVIVHENKFKFTEEKGWLTFGDVEVTPEEMTAITQQTKDQMTSKMLSDEYLETVKEKATYIIVDRLRDINPEFNIKVVWK